MTQPSRTWHVSPPDEVRSEDVGGLALIYHRASGQTHLLAEPLPQILSLIDPEGTSESDLIRRLHAGFDVVESDRLDERVRECLCQLAALGLAYPA